MRINETLRVSDCRPKTDKLKLKTNTGKIKSDRTVLIISPYFPPSTLAGVHRARHLAKHLPRAGWNPVIMCVDERDHVQKLDLELANLLPTDLEMIKVRGLPAWFTRLAGIGDISLRSWFSLKQALLEVLEKRPIDVVMITGSPFYPMLFAPLITNRFRVPVVLDFQDPWVAMHNDTYKSLSKSGLVQWIAREAEPRALSAARFITSVSEVQNEQMRRRYPWLDESHMAAIPIGGDPEDFDSLRTNSAREPALSLAPDKVHFSYVGTCLPRAKELFRTVFRAYSRFRYSAPSLAAKVQLHFIGTSNQPDAETAFQIRPIAEEEGVGDSVHEIAQRLPYLQALRWLAQSDGLLLIGSDEPHYTASKVYPALMSGAPYVSLFHCKSGSHDLLSSAGGGRSLCFDRPTELAALEEPLADALHQLATRPQVFGRSDPLAYDAYTARAVSLRFAEIFSTISDRNGGHGRPGAALERHRNLGE